MDQCLREEEQIEQDYERGYLTQEQYNDALRDLWRAYRDAAEQAAQRAYDEEKERW